ncbi:MAG: tRNA (adenosine(37)-N6)-threonylcarbamoyltransferase complex dimerization subunit type 1 TsaB [Terriglobia bacterium]|nr:MAG: tRNA (adenosine(37)-N6)-threonylcarbamoyltransferase complex dimerization subunit type 1 TsaB [Terriglobia bacterium]
MSRTRRRAKGELHRPGRSGQELSGRDEPAGIRNERQRKGVRARPRAPTHPVKPLLLAIDTTHEFGSIALARGMEVLEEVALHAPDGFAHVIYGQLRDLLERRRLNPEDIDCFAAASGPGSFTGVRVGLACVKGLAEACGKPAAGVSNLQAMAWYGSAPLRAVVMDARRGEIYGAVYNAAGDLVAPETVGGFSKWLESLPEGDLEFVSADSGLVREALEGTRWETAPLVTAPRALAAAIATIACARLVRGEACDPAALDANYVRRSDAELFWKE